jgi:pyruvate,orthophosphate dikinase
MGWADPFRKMKVRANADIPRDAIQARAFGAEGIGLCRTEHMFFGEEKIGHMRTMILADNEKDRRAALKKPTAARRFCGVFKAMDAGHDPHTGSAVTRVPATPRGFNGRHRAAVAL